MVKYSETDIRGHVSIRSKTTIRQQPNAVQCALILWLEVNEANENTGY